MDHINKNKIHSKHTLFKLTRFKRTRKLANFSKKRQNFRYCKAINKMFSGIFTLYFIIAIAAACMQIFIFTQDGIPLANRIKCLLYFLAEVMQASIYCTNAELISEAANEIADAAYESEWYETDLLQFRKYITQIIARAQKQIEFSGYGLVKINLGTLVTIFKTAMSFYTYLNSVGAK